MYSTLPLMRYFIRYAAVIVISSKSLTSIEIARRKISIVYELI